MTLSLRVDSKLVSFYKQINHLNHFLLQPSVLQQVHSLVPVWPHQDGPLTPPLRRRMRNIMNSKKPLTTAHP